MNSFSRYKRRSEMLLSKRNMGATERWRADIAAREVAVAIARDVKFDYAYAQTALSAIVSHNESLARKRETV